MRRMAVALAGIFTMAAASAAVEMPMIVAHRGESVERPENSMAAYRLAFERGVDGVECDVYATTDGKGVLIHDATTKRTAGSDYNYTVESCSWDALKDVAIGNFGSWANGEYANETIPLLDDYLALLSLNDTSKCVIEIKGTGNNITNVLASAIRNQPLATSNRVVFISFEWSLIRDIRAELPGYEAWLLLTSTTSYNTGAKMVSLINQYNATGVNVSKSLAFTAEDVAAVKAAGYKFAVWTTDTPPAMTDSADGVLELAQRGVQVFTTNAAKELKDELAPLIENANNYAEIVDPDQPLGGKRWDVGDYVQDGLVGHFDGIRNVGAGLGHDSAAAKWKNLVANQPDASFHLANATSGNWKDNAYYFNGGSYAQVDSPGIALGLDCTIQLATDVDYSVQPVGSGKYPNFFAFPNDFALFFNNNNTKGTRTSTLTWKTEPYGESSSTRRPTMSWNGKYVTAILGTQKYLTQSASYGTAVTRGKRSDQIPATLMTWGGSANGPDARYTYSTIHAVRLYNRALTETELAQNFQVDEIRFRANGANVIVESNVAGLEGTGGNGNWTVNGTHTFTAPASVVLDGRTWAPTGYKAERWNPAKFTWDLIEEGNATSYAYTNCLARAQERLTWNWRLVEGVKRLDADDYVQAGLVHQFDGIRNAGLAEPHAADATTWKNLAAGCGATRMTQNAAKPGAWHEKGYEFQGGDYFKLDASTTIGRQATAQVVCDYNDDAQFTSYPAFFGEPGDAFNIYVLRDGSSFNATQKRGDLLHFKADATTGLAATTRSQLQPWHGRFINAVLDYNRSGLGQNAGLAYKAGTFKKDVGSKNYTMGSAGSDSSALGQRMLVGRLYAMRLYDRVLTTTELQHNYEVDNARFLIGAGRSTDTDLVEVTSELPAFQGEDLGCWMVRGTGASKTFSAPATFETANAVFTCAGYRLETWDAAKRQWLNPVTTANATSCTLTGTSGAANRRLTWLWTRMKALRTAADYDVADYVQQGLVANYDGIRNRGADMPHAAKGMGWRDLSYRDNLMVSSADALHTAWSDSGLVFSANGFTQMQDSIDLGQEHTEQGVLDVNVSAQTTSYPCYFSPGFEDYGIFTRGKGNTLEWKYDKWGGGKNTSTRATSAGWTGQYINSVITSAKMCLFEGTTIPTGTSRSKYVACDGNRWALGAASASGYTDARKTKGTYMAARFYNRSLTEAELAQNRKVDEIRYRGNFADYRNVEVEREQPFEGAEATAVESDGVYEVVGEWTFTSNAYTYEQPVEGSDETVTKTLPPFCKISTYSNGAWSKPVYRKTGSYTYTAGGDPVKITWTWKAQSGVLILVH